MRDMGRGGALLAIVRLPLDDVAGAVDPVHYAGSIRPFRSRGQGGRLGARLELRTRGAPDVVGGEFLHCAEHVDASPAVLAERTHGGVARHASALGRSIPARARIWSTLRSRAASGAPMTLAAIRSRIRSRSASKSSDGI